MTNIKLGLCKPPEPIRLYVGRSESIEIPHNWYCYDIDRKEATPIPENGLTGYIKELRIIVKEYKGKENHKLDVVIAADEIYIVRSGIDTNFAKTFLLAASIVEDFSIPLVISVASGEENVVFGRIYNAATKERFRKEWNPDEDWLSLVENINSRLKQQSPKLDPLERRKEAMEDCFTTLEWDIDQQKRWGALFNSLPSKSWTLREWDAAISDLQSRIDEQAAQIADNE